MTQRDVPRSVANKLYVAVDEIATNILQYSGAATLRVALEITANDVTMVFEDDGVAFDPLAKPDPDVTLALEDRQIGGLGIFMVKKSMDEISYRYQDGKNILTMMKRFSKGEKQV